MSIISNSGFAKIKVDWLKFMIVNCKEYVKEIKNSNQDKSLFIPFHYSSPKFVDYLAISENDLENDSDNIDKKNIYYSAQGILYLPNQYLEIYSKILKSLNTPFLPIQKIHELIPVEKTAFIFTDGASDVKSTPRKAGWAFYYSMGNKNVVNYGPLIQQYDTNGEMLNKTNNQAEGIAIIKAIEFLIEHGIICDVTLVTDSKLYINIITDYMHNWHNQDPDFNCNTNGGTPIKNVNIIRKLYCVYTKYTEQNKINIVHINSHRKAPYDINSQEYKLWSGNNIADKYASKGRESECDNCIRLD